VCKSHKSVKHPSSIRISWHGHEEDAGRLREGGQALLIVDILMALVSASILIITLYPALSGIRFGSPYVFSSNDSQGLNILWVTTTKIDAGLRAQLQRPDPGSGVLSSALWQNPVSGAVAAVYCRDGENAFVSFVVGDVSVRERALPRRRIRRNHAAKATITASATAE